MLFNGQGDKLSEHAQLNLTPVHILLNKLRVEDRGPIFEEALFATCAVLKIPFEEFVRRMDDPKRVARAAKALYDQTDLSVRAQLFVQNESEKQERRIDAYLSDPQERAHFILLPDRAEIGGAIREVTDVLTVDKEFSDQELDGDQRALFHHHITAFLFARHQDRTFEPEVSEIGHLGPRGQPIEQRPLF